MTIYEVILEKNGTYRVRAEVDENRTHFFNFDHYPSQEDVDVAVATLLEGEQAQIQEDPSENI